MSKEVVDSFKAFLIEKAELTDNEGYPKIRKDMISKEIPIDIITFKESIKIPKEQRKKYYVCTFSPDKSFARIFNNPKRYIDYFKQFAGIIGFDFSIHSDMPPIVQKSQMNINISLTYYYGNNGILVIPNIRTGSNYLSQEFFETIPKNTLVAVGTHGFIKTRVQRYEWYYCLREIIDKLNPSGIIVYGTLRGKLFDKIKEMVPIYQYDSWAEKKYKREKAKSMATKGLSNKYGNENGTASIKINFPYVVPKYIGSNPKDHMVKHYSDFGVDNSTDYIAKAVNFGNDIDRINYDSFVDHSGTTYKYNKRNNALLIVSKEGNIITYFKPRYKRGPKKGQLNWNYFDSQRKEKIDNERQFGKR